MKFLLEKCEFLRKNKSVISSHFIMSARPGIIITGIDTDFFPLICLNCQKLAYYIKISTQKVHKILTLNSKHNFFGVGGIPWIKGCFLFTCPNSKKICFLHFPGIYSDLYFSFLFSLEISSFETVGGGRKKEKKIHMT